MAARTREQELRAALRGARLPPGVHRLVSHLLDDRADWRSAVIPEGRQPRNNAALAARLGVSERQLQRYVRDAESYGWIACTRQPGRGKTTTYQLAIGRDMPGREPAMTGAERTRRWREKARQASVTTPRGKGDMPSSLEPRKGDRSASLVTTKVRHSDGAIRHTSAGQSPAMLKGISRGEGVEGKPRSPEKSAPSTHPSRREYKGGPVSWDAPAPVVADTPADSAPPQIPRPAEPAPPERLMVTIAGKTHEAITCRGCGNLVPVEFAADGYHMSCKPPESSMHPREPLARDRKPATARNLASARKPASGARRAG